MINSVPPTNAPAFERFVCIFLSFHTFPGALSQCYPERFYIKPYAGQVEMLQTK
jgi:hypothetical protein